MVERPAVTTLLRLDPPIVPPWVGDAIGSDAPPGTEMEKDGVVVQTRGSGDLLFVRTTLPEAGALDDAAFLQGVARCYVASAEVFAGRERTPVRIWNYVPSISQPSDDGFSRYEVFNAGRELGCKEAYGVDQAPRRVTASAVGHRGTDLVVHTLAARSLARPFENPRQLPAYHYSARYGPQPPCFCRASSINGLGMVAGTASIVGEDSSHVGDLAGQVDEMFLNLATIAAEVAGTPLGGAPSHEALSASLGRYRELRIYVVNEADTAIVASAIARSFSNLARFDLAAADLCRPELLVEAEGILDLAR